MSDPHEVVTPALIGLFFAGSIKAGSGHGADVLHAL